MLSDAVRQWLLDSDPSICWQVMSDLTDASAEDVAAEYARVATEGWGARLLAMQGEASQWVGARCSWRGGLNPAIANGAAISPGRPQLTALSTCMTSGLIPNDNVRRSMAQVRENGRWEYDGQPFFGREVEPCINGMVVVLGTYFEQDVNAGVY